MITVSFTLLAEGAVCLILPIIALLVWHGKTKARVSPFFVGALMFFVFALVLEQLLHSVVLGGGSALSRTINGNLFYKAVYGGLAAGVFEETGRLVGFRTLLKKQTGRSTAITYGIGHGGFECMMVGGVNGIAYGLVASGVLGASVLGAAADTVSAAIAATAPMTPLWGIMERVSAMLLHLGLSVFVFTAASHKGKRWLFPAAILIHAAVDAGFVIAAGYISSTAAIEALVFVCGAAVLLAGLKIYYKLPKDVSFADGETVVE